MNILNLDIQENRKCPIVSVVNQSAFGKKNDAMVAEDYKQKTFDLATDQQRKIGKKYRLQSIITPPIVNPIIANLTGSTTELTILRLSESIIKVEDNASLNWLAIIYGKTIYDRTSNMLISASSVANEQYDSNKYLICGELVQYILNLITKDDIKNIFAAKIEVSKDSLEDLKHKIDTVENKEDFDLNDEVILDGLKKEANIRGTQGKIINICGIDFYEDSTILGDICKSNICLLDELYRNMDGLKKFIINKLYVLPDTLRPSGAVSSDPITKKYLKIINEVNAFANARTAGATVGFVIQGYNKVQNAVTSLFKTKSNDLDVTLADKLSHKEGIIRQDCIGVRSDLSARTVITLNSKLRTGWIGLPRKIAFKIFENILLREMELQYGINRKEYMKTRSINEMMEDVEIFNGAPVIIGRNPTLFYLGIQKRRVEIVDGSAIQMSPLDVAAFAADFDGDTMHVEAIGDIYRGQYTNNEYMYEEYNGRRFYTWYEEEDRDLPFSGRIQYVFPKDGSPTREIKQDMMYGLVVALGFGNIKREIYNETSYKGDVYNDEKCYTEAIRLIAENKLSPYELVDGRDYTYAQAIIGSTAGINESDAKFLTGQHLTKDGVKTIEQATKLINSGYLPKTVSVGDAQRLVSIGSLNLSKILLQKYDNTTDFRKIEEMYLEKLNRLKDLGFAVAKVFPPDLDIITTEEINSILSIDYNKLINDTKKDITKAIMSPFIARGDDTTIRAAYKKLNAQEDKLKKSNLNNGWTTIIKSGARGKMENVQQTLLTKGFIKDCSSGIISNAILSNYANGITNYENFIIANGGRAALVDKSISTAQPGYLSRQLSYSCSNIEINGEDCGTNELLPITKEIIIKTQKHLDHTYDAQGNYFVPNDIMYGFMKTNIMGRYIRLNGSDIKITKDNVKQILNDWINNEDKNNALWLYSPMFCNNRCCKKCYGDDIRKLEIVDGMRIGYVAAQAVSEPSTQLTMKKFQSGGVETDEDLSSAIQVLGAMLNGTHDIIYNNYGKTYSGLTTRNIAVKTLFGIMNILWSNDGKVNMKHIEVVLSSLIRFVYNDKGAGKGYVKNTGNGIPVFYGLKSGIQHSANAFERIAFEDIGKGISSSLITSDLNEESVVEQLSLGMLKE